MPGLANVFGRRDQPGAVTVSKPLPLVTGPWLNAASPDGAPVPAQVAAQLLGRQFPSFDAFRFAFWKAVANVPELAGQFDRDAIEQMRRGSSPNAPPAGQAGSRLVYELHHAQPISTQGPVYDLSNIRVISPYAHIETHKAYR